MRKKPDGVVVYNGRDGKVFRIKYRDATGSQVMETVGRERDGMTRAQAAKIRRERVVKVEQRGWRKPAPLTFRDFSETWFEEGQTKRGWKPKTVRGDRGALDRLHADEFASLPLNTVRPRNIDGYARQALSVKRKRTGGP